MIPLAPPAANLSRESFVPTLFTTEYADALTLVVWVLGQHTRATSRQPGGSFVCGQGVYRGHRTDAGVGANR